MVANLQKKLDFQLVQRRKVMKPQGLKVSNPADRAMVQGQLHQLYASLGMATSVTGIARSGFDDHFEQK